MKKQLTILATSILAASANAAFEEGNAVLYAWDSADNDTYFVDLGAIDLSDGSGSFIDTYGGLAAWLAFQTSVSWSVVHATNLALH